MDLESFGQPQSFKTGEKILIWRDRLRTEIWLDRIRQLRWDVPTREQVEYEITATYTT